MRAIQCTNGVCVKMTAGDYEVSIAFENAMYNVSPTVGRVYNRTTIRIYKNALDVTKEFTDDVLKDELDLLAVMNVLVEKSLGSCHGAVSGA